MRQISACSAFRFDEVSLEEALGNREGWERLADHALEPNPFFEPAFFEPFAKHLAGAGVRIAWLRNPATGDLAALVPIISRRLGLGFSGKPPRFFSHDYGPLATPLLHRDQAQDAAMDLICGLLSKRSMICAPHTRMSGPVYECLRHAAHANGGTLRGFGHYPRAMQDAREPGEDYLARALSKSRRRQYAKQMRRLSARGAVRIESPSDPENIKDAFDHFLKLEAAGWKGRGGSALMSRPPALRFAREMAAGLISQGRMRADVMTFDEQPVGMVINLRAGRDIFPWKMAFDETYRAASPGMQTLLHTTETNCRDTGIDRADSLTGPDTPTVDMLWKERCPMGTLVLSVGPVGALKARILDYDKTGHDVLRRTVKSLFKRPA